MLGNLGMSEILMILVIVLLIFGAKRLPEIGSAMGKGIREFKKSMREVTEDIDRPEPPAEPRRLPTPDEPRRQN
ncbi:MAG: twin-arginine translocase TatA/TatE family subunit [Gemmatimonadetes bacterium]|nr:twin-arginine translocase TatA/TatE family subunit [Gemmatimonadota bacterium]